MDLAREFREWRTWAAGNAPLYEHLADVVAEDPDMLELARTIPEDQTRPTLLFAAVHASLLRDPEHDLARFYPTVADEPDPPDAGGSGEIEAGSDESVQADSDESIEAGGTTSHDPSGDGPLDADEVGEIDADDVGVLDADDAGVPDPGNAAALDPDDPHAPDLASTFAAFCGEREAELREYFETRRTQTNAVGRCAALYPAFAHVASLADEPLALVEVGPSAGLNLLFDRYAYDYWRGGASPLRVGATNSPVQIESELRAGSPPLPEEPPAIASRIGVDVDPLDVTDGADRRWIRACTWPEHRHRHRVLDDALDLAARRPPSIVAGDAIEHLPELVAGIPEDTPVCVFDTLVLYHADEAYRERFEETLAACSEDRELYWLTGERPSEAFEQAIELDLVRPASGEREHLATFEMHGRWLRWEV